MPSCPFILFLHHPFWVTDWLTDIIPQGSSLLSWAAPPALNQWWLNWMAVQLLTISWRKYGSPNAQTGNDPNVHQWGMHQQCCTNRAKYSSATKKIGQLLRAATWANLEILVSRESRYKTGYALWFHLYENLEKEKLKSSDRKQSNCFCSWVGEVLTGKSHKGIFWGDGQYIYIWT